MAGAAVDALKALLLHNARLQRELDQRSAELLDTQRQLERSVLRPTYRWRSGPYAAWSRAGPAATR